MTSILQKIAQGDETAVSECLDAYGGVVWRLARRYLSFAEQDVDDAVQEVFVELWLSAGRFDPAMGSEAAFVATVAHRRLIDYQRRVTARRGSLRRVEPNLAEAPSSLWQVQGRQERSLVAEQFDLLPEDERRAVWLSIYGGLSHREIAEATSCPIGTVKTRLRRAFVRLHSAMAPVERMTKGGERA